MLLKFLKIFTVVMSLLLLLSCESRIFKEIEPEWDLVDGVYLLNTADFSTDHIVLSNDSMLITVFPCGEEKVFQLFNIENSVDLNMSLLADGNVILEKNIYLNPVKSKDLKISVLDVKQGDSFIIEPEETFPTVIDGGFGSLGFYEYQDGGNTTLLDHLKYCDINSLKYIIETHHDADHYGGLYDVVEDGSINYSEYISPDTNTVFLNDTLFFSENVFGIVYHYGDVAGQAETEENSRSIIFSLHYKDFEMLFTGDIESDVEGYLLGQEEFLSFSGYDVLKVPHHGSSSSSTQGFVSQIDPKLSIISCGEGNPWGFPVEDVLSRLEEWSDQILRTDLNGDTFIYTDGVSMQIVNKK